MEEDSNRVGHRLFIRLARLRQLGNTGEVRTVQVTRNEEGRLGLGLTDDNKIVEIYNPNQIHVRLGDQIRAVNGIPLGSSKMQDALDTVTDKTFDLEVARYSQASYSLPEWDVYFKFVPQPEMADADWESDLCPFSRFPIVGTEFAHTIPPQTKTMKIQVFVQWLFWPDTMVGEMEVDCQLKDDEVTTQWHCIRTPKTSSYSGYSSWGGSMDPGGELKGEMLVNVRRWSPQLAISPDSSWECPSDLPFSFPEKEPTHECMALPRVEEFPDMGETLTLSNSNATHQQQLVHKQPKPVDSGEEFVL